MVLFLHGCYGDGKMLTDSDSRYGRCRCTYVYSVVVSRLDAGIVLRKLIMGHHTNIISYIITKASLCCFHVLVKGVLNIEHAQ